MKRATIFVFVSLFSLSSMAVDNMTIFLKSCAYGTVAGAVIGLATLATSENPDGKMSNVARGASLGLYAGIGFGLYTIYSKPSSGSLDIAEMSDRSSEIAEMSAVINPVWFSPIQKDQRIDGLQLNWAKISF